MPRKESPKCEQQQLLSCIASSTCVRNERTLHTIRNGTHTKRIKSFTICPSFSVRNSVLLSVISCVVAKARAHTHTHANILIAKRKIEHEKNHSKRMIALSCVPPFVAGVVSVLLFNSLCPFKSDRYTVYDLPNE